MKQQTKRLHVCCAHTALTRIHTTDTQPYLVALGTSCPSQLAQDQFPHPISEIKTIPRYKNQLVSDLYPIFNYPISFETLLLVWSGPVRVPHQIPCSSPGRPSVRGRPLAGGPVVSDSGEEVSVVHGAATLSTRMQELLPAGRGEGLHLVAERGEASYCHCKPFKTHVK